MGKRGNRTCIDQDVELAGGHDDVRSGLDQRESSRVCPTPSKHPGLEMSLASVKSDARLLEVVVWYVR